MKSSIPPQIGERFFLYHREVVVTQTYVGVPSGQDQVFRGI